METEFNSSSFDEPGLDDMTIVREYRPSDLSFILDSWVKTLRGKNDLFRQIDKEIYFKIYPGIVKTLVENSTTRLVVLAEDHDIILAYAVFVEETLHWCFVKEQWRHLGLAKRLVPEKIKFISHMTDNVRSLVKKQHWRFNPFL